MMYGKVAYWCGCCSTLGVSFYCFVRVYVCLSVCLFVSICSCVQSVSSSVVHRL